MEQREENQGCCCIGRRKNNGTRKSILLPFTALFNYFMGAWTTN